MARGRLRLVGADEPPPVQAQLVAWARATEGVLPDDARLLSQLWPCLPRPSVEALAVAVEASVARGDLRRVHIGREPHLTAAPRAEGADGEPRDPQPGEDAFLAQVERDAAHEKALLYRVAIVIEGLVGLALLRELASTLLGG